VQLAKHIDMIITTLINKGRKSNCILFAGKQKKKKELKEGF